MSNPDPIMVLIRKLADLPHETEWVEFKVNNANPDEIGEYISSLSNSATLHNQSCGYLVWGVKNDNHNLVGTAFRPRATKVGNEELENWLSHHLAPRIHFVFKETDLEGKHFVLLEVPPAAHTPIRFKNDGYIRVGTIKKKLREHVEKERELWSKFERTPFEEVIAKRGVSPDQVLQLIDYPAYFDATDQSLPDRAGILDRFEQEKFIVTNGNQYDITSLGAILFAKELQSFIGLGRKSVRVIFYRGVNRVDTIREQEGHRGYGVGFVGLIEYINGYLPKNEHIELALRKEVPVYPEIAVRELVANALIHQDFSISGTGPMIEVFEDRMEITNPGVPLIDPQRFLGSPPRSRNEGVASFLRRVGVCEERGSGITKVITAVEVFQLPPPDFRTSENHTKAILYAPKAFRDMDRNDRIRACYQHACLEYVSNRQMTNSSLRGRFGFSEGNSAQASRVIREALDAKMIKEHDPTNQSKKHSRYVPFWA